MIAIALGIAVVFFLFPKHEHELALLDRYHGEDGVGEAAPAGRAAIIGDGLPPAQVRRRLLAPLEPDAGREHRPRQAARGELAGSAAVAAGAGAGLDQAPPLRAEELYVLLEGSGRVRIDDEEPLTLAPLDSLLVEPGSVAPALQRHRRRPALARRRRPAGGRQHAGDERGAAARRCTRTGRRRCRPSSTAESPRPERWRPAH